MTNEELNTALYEKMFAEQETYRAWLLSQPPEEILNHAYEYTVREDILMSMEYHNLPDAQAKAPYALTLFYFHKYSFLCYNQHEVIFDEN